MDVGLRELKLHLSGYLDRAAKGETIRVTDRGQPKVLIVPIAGAGALERGVDEGWIRPAARHGLRPARRARSSERVADVLEDDRDDS